MRLQLLGENCTDVYVYGKCPRLSPEAPVPVFVPVRTVTAPGMAGNVLANLRALNVSARLLTQQETCTKTRYVEESRNHCLLRVDEDPVIEMPFLGRVDLTVPLAVSDYNKGFLTREWLDESPLPALSFLDTKRPLDHWCSRYSFIKLNEAEYLASKAFIDSAPYMMKEKLIVTLGAGGARWNGQTFVPEHVEQVMDVTGAGDTFFAAFIAYTLRNPGRTSEAIRYANRCAAQVVAKRGTSVVDPSLALCVASN